VAFAGPTPAYCTNNEKGISVKLFTREEKRNEDLMGLYQMYVDQGLKPQRAVDKAREEVAKKNKKG
jgi:hypothetical protein